MKRIIFSFFITLLLISCTTKSTVLLNQKEIIALSNTGITSKVKSINYSGTIDKVVNKDIKIETNIPNQVSGFEKDLEDFSVNYKKALSNLSIGNKLGIEQTKNITEEWGNIISKYRGYSVKGFEKTKNLDEELITIGIYLLNSSDFNTSGKMDLGYNELEKVSIVISKIRQENSINSISDDMYNIKTNIEKLIIDGKIKDEAKFEELRGGIKKLSQYKIADEEYIKILSQFEKSLIDSNRLLGEEYVKQLPELQKIFMKIYLKYGK